MLDVMEGKVYDKHFVPGEKKKIEQKHPVYFYKCLIYVSYPILSTDHWSASMEKFQNSVSPLIAALD